MGVDVKSTRLSVQALSFCTSADGFKMTCTSATTLDRGARALVAEAGKGSLPSAECLPYNPYAQTSETVCQPRCSAANPFLKQGLFQWTNVDGFFPAQRDIITAGSVVTRIDIYSDFRAFFARNPVGVYRGPSPSAKLEFAHAVVLVGFNNDEGYWVAKNSWGPKWADGGYFKVGTDIAKTLMRHYALSDSL